MSVFLVLGIALLIALWFAIVIAVIMYDLEKHREEKLQREDEEYNQRMISMCIKCKSAGTCIGYCSKCAWGLRKKNGVVEFRG